MGENTTTIQISIENYKRLSGMKNPGDSFDDVVGRVLDEYEVVHRRDSATGTDFESVNAQTQSSNHSNDKKRINDEEKTDPAQPPTSKSSRQMAFSSTNRLEDDVEQELIQLDLSTNKARKKWIPAVRGAYRYLREHKQVSKQDFIDDVFSDESAGYENEQTWWRKVIRPALTDLPRVKKPKPGGQWKFTANNE